MTEKGYASYVEDRLKEKHGAENVKRNVYLPQTYRYVDFLVDCGTHTLAVEVEHSSDKVVEEGYAQAQMYAKHNRKWAPAIIYPPDGENEEELEMVGQDVVLIPIPHKHR